MSGRIFSGGDCITGDAAKKRECWNPEFSKRTIRNKPIFIEYYQIIFRVSIDSVFGAPGCPTLMK